MNAARMIIRQKGILALDAKRQIARDEQIEDSIDAIRRNAPSHDCAQPFSNFIGADWLTCLGKNLEHIAAHFGPLLAFSSQDRASRIGQ